MDVEQFRAHRRQYMREYRTRRNASLERAKNRARMRAVTRVARSHPDELAKAVAAEYVKEGLT